MSIGGSGRTFALTLVGALLLSSVAGVAMGANSALNYSDSAELPDGEMDFTVEKAEHKMSWGTGPAALSKYYDDNGDVASAPWVINQTADNPVQFYATDIEDEQYGKFPRKSPESNNSASALDANEWTTDSSATAGSVSVSDTTTAESVDAVQISTSSQTSGDVATATYGNFSIESDVPKRALQTAVDVNTLDSGAHVEIRAMDADGDYVRFVVDSSESASNETVLANGTVTGAVGQSKISSMTVMGSGDGTMSEIQELTVRVEDADADLSIAWLDAQRKSVTTLATMQKDTDDDDALETVDVVRPRGWIKTHDLGTASEMFSDATIHGITFDATQGAEQLDAADVTAEREQSSKYGYDSVATFQYRFGLPAAIDLTYSDVSFETEQEWPGDRYLKVELIEGAGDTAFEDLDYTNNGNDLTGSYSSEGTEIVLDDTVEVGTNYALKVKFTGFSDEVNTMFAGGGGGGGLFGAAGGGGMFGGVFGFLGGAIDWVVGGILSALGIGAGKYGS